MASQPAILPERVVLTDIPFFPQTRYHCGPAALATVLNSSQVQVTPEQLVPLVYVPERTGSFQTEITATARSFGRVAYQLDPSLEQLLLEIAAGNPVLTLQNLGLARLPQWHFAIVKGYDLKQQHIVLNSGEIEDYRISMQLFERTWARAAHWSIVVLQPGEIPVTAEAERYLRALLDLQNSFGNFDGLAAAYRESLRHWPGNRNLGMGLGNLLLADGNHELAVAAYNEVLHHFPNYGPAHNNLAQALLMLRQPEAALRHVHQALATDDDFVQSYADTLTQINRALDAR